MLLIYILFYFADTKSDEMKTGSDELGEKRDMPTQVGSKLVSFILTQVSYWKIIFSKLKIAYYRHLLDSHA